MYMHLHECVVPLRMGAAQLHVDNDSLVKSYLSFPTSLCTYVRTLVLVHV